MNGLRKKAIEHLSLTPALFIWILISAQPGNSSDWASLIPSVNSPLQSASCHTTGFFDYRAESNTLETSEDLLYPWSSIVETDDLLMLSSGREVTIALIDSGIDTCNPIFTSVLWQNSLELADDGVDNDGNGYVDDMYGWNFGDQNGMVTDQNGHGTNVAGIIMRSAPDARMMILKINSGDSNTFYTDAVVSALYYAVNAGANVINMSLSLAKESSDVENAIKYAVSRGVMLVVAAGNSSTGITFPGTVDEIITVGATTADGRAILWNSPAGATIDITAPGKDVETFGLGGNIVFATGTSFSAPMVSGAIAALLGMNRNLKPGTIENIIFNGTRDLGDEGKDDTSGWGILSGTGIRKSATPAIVATKITHSTKNSTSSITESTISTADSFEISCYLPPTDSYTDIYIALVKNQPPDTDRSDAESIWWLDSNGTWKGNDHDGIISIASLNLDNIGLNFLLFGDLVGLWPNFSPSQFEPGSYKIGIALIGDRGLLAPISWSQMIF